ncbi:hypothetical protein [Niveibacterium microcysteis]|uniref:Uncharacterized protein n=1 Tax=Niveibacterium microcysteis TaxID=2811415 RepID=A0ABX7MCB1_9RHOO|nr:hypothetical protein [Niveibacterium microcysteis]QSI78274.1 hypothetical protein JY500_06480 [Niveibacterium microcysteis]
MPTPRFQPDDWRAALATGRIAFRLTQDATCVTEGLLREPAQLDVRVAIATLDTRTEAHIGGEFLHFIASGRRSATYQCHAHRTIEKFGQAIQFSAPFTLQLAWIDPASAAALHARRDLFDWQKLTGARAVLRHWRAKLCPRH